MEDSIEVAADGYAWFIAKEASIKRLVASFGASAKPTRVVIVCERLTVGDPSLANLIGSAIVPWAKATSVIQESVPLPLLTAYLTVHQIDVAFVIRHIDLLKYGLLTFKGNTFALSAEEITLFLQPQESSINELHPSNRSFSYRSLKMEQILAATLQTIPTFITAPLDIVQSSDLQMTFLLGSSSTASIGEYLQTAIDLFALKGKLVKAPGDTGDKPWPTEWKDQEALLKSRLLTYHRETEHTSESSLHFSFSDDGQQMMVALVDGPATQKETLHLLTDSQVATLLLWWLEERRQFDLKYADFTAANPNELTKASKPLTADNSQLAIFACEHLCKCDLRFGKIAKRAKATVVNVSDIDDIVDGQVQVHYQKTGSRYVLASDGEARYLVTGGQSWDAVAASLQLVQLAISAKAYAKYSLRQILARL